MASDAFKESTEKWAEGLREAVEQRDQARRETAAALVERDALDKQLRAVTLHRDGDNIRVRTELNATKRDLAASQRRCEALVAALTEIAEYSVDWTKGPGDNVGNLQEIAELALAGNP